MRIGKYIMKQNQQPYLYYHLNEKSIFNTRKTSKQLIRKKDFFNKRW